MLFFSACVRMQVTKKEDIEYSAQTKLTLNVFSPKKKDKELKQVLVFVHGGNWANGDKSLYGFFGRGMAKKGIVAVVIDYRLYPSTTYDGMAMDVAQSVKWVKEHIASYGGNPDSIFISGHSAGAHLAALIATDNSYFDSLEINNPIKGCILIDAFGLDMYSYLKKEDKYKYDVYRSVFTKDTLNWKKGSPVYHLHEGMPPFQIFVGGKTYPNIREGSKSFLETLKKFQPDAVIIKVPRKRHVGMIFSYANPRKKAYGQVLRFMKKAGR